MRWIETRYVIRGKNPFDVMFAHDPMMKAYAPPTASHVTRDCSMDEDLGWSSGTVYPPWAYISSICFLWVPRWALQNWYAALMTVSLLSILVWALAEGWRFDRWGAALFAAGAIAIAGWTRALYLGNYPLPLTLFAIGTLLCLRTRRPILAGLLLGIALLKPTLLGPFFLVFLVRKDYLAAVVTSAYVAAATVACWILSKTNPLEMLSQMSAASRPYMSGGYGPVQALIALHFTPNAATAIAGLAGFVACCLALYLARTKDPLILFGIAGIAARLWSYHYYYDDGIMVFALIALGVYAFKHKSIMHLAWFLLFGLSLWMPARVSEVKLLVQFLEVAIWIGGAIVLVSIGRNDSFVNEQATFQEITGPLAESAPIVDPNWQAQTSPSPN